MFCSNNLEIYPGKQSDGPYQFKNKSMDIAEILITSITNSGRNVTTDNWFSDASLLQTLSEKTWLILCRNVGKKKQVADSKREERGETQRKIFLHFWG
ncbi:hypothetical protein NPIL_100051 [Nephila pilipes]|uniref:PiggyBac transposable element-derived protein domain-containing protein n=1 Tax=Nephila pilipes TaxID=299642 RepID=A0A8X6NQF1_NEPPI|nr:hypothetical protein NPIL_100051 [Nephila pilipes]